MEVQAGGWAPTSAHKASSYPRLCQVTDWSGESSLRARRGRAAGLWLALCRPSPAPSLFCSSAAPGGRCVPLPTTSVPFVPSFERPARHPFLRQVSAQPPPPRPAALSSGERINRAMGGAAPTPPLPWWGGLCSGRAVPQGLGGPAGIRRLGRGLWKVPQGCPSVPEPCRSPVCI